VNGLSACSFGNIDDAILTQITVLWSGTSNEEGFICLIIQKVREHKMKLTSS
jgi:hypothetical protein